MVKQKTAKKSFRFLFVLAFAFAMSMFMTSAAFADGTAGVDSWQSLENALDNGAETIVLTDDITAGENSNPLIVTGHVSIDLRGHTLNRGLSNASQAAGDGYVIKVAGAEGELTIEALSGGSITGGNNSDNGGGVIVENGGSLTLNGGIISGNKCKGNGGGVYVQSGSFTMWRGEITDNLAALDGGGVALFDNETTGQGSTLSLHSTVVIDGNKKVTDGNAEKNNVYLDTSNDKIILDEHSQLKDSAIGVTMKTPGVFTSSNGVKASEYAEFFSSDDNKFDVQADGNELKLVTAPDTYDVWVGATQVTKENKGDVLGDGKVKFKPAVSDDTPATLTLNNPTIKDVYRNSYTAVIYSTLDKLAIKGKATLTNPDTTHSSTGIYATGCDVELNGEFTVKAGAGAYGIAARNLTVSGGTVDVKNSIITVTNDFTITGGDVIVKSSDVSVNTLGKIDIRGGSLDATTSSDYGVAIHSKGEITIADDLGITKPKCGAVGEKEDEGNKYWTVLDGENVASSVTIEPAFTVTFDDGQGSTLRTEAVKAGQAATAPADPTREGYAFDGWDKEFSNVTSNLTVSATWVQTYPVWVGATHVTEKNKDDILGDGGKAKYDPDSSILTLDNPSIKDVYSNGPGSFDACIYTEKYLFIKGKATLTNVRSNTNSNGIYATDQLKLDGDFTINAGYYGIHAKNFGMPGGNVNVTSDAGFYANNILITGGTLTSAAKVCGLEASKKIGLDNNMSIVSPRGGDIVTSTLGQWVVDASGNRAKVVVISEKSNLKLVTFSAGYKDNSGREIILKADTVESGQGATAPADPTRPGYTFVGWDTDFSNVTEDLTVTAKWKENVVPVETDQYAVWVGATKVTKDNRDDVLGDGGKVKYDPVTNTLTLDDPEIKDVYKADSDAFDACIYSKLDSSLVIKGKATLTNVQSKRNSHGIYASGHDVKLDGDFTVNAGYYGIIARDLTVSGGTVTVESKAGVRTQNNIDVKGGTLISISSGTYGLYANNDINIGEGLSIVRPAGGTIEKNSEFGYTYIQDADGNAAKQVIISSEPDWYFVTFSDGQGGTLKTEAVKGGKAATAPEDPTREGYTFGGWDKDFSNITEDLTVTAKWKQNGGGGATISIKNAKVVLSASAFAYNGKIRKPAIKKIGGKALKAGTDYTVKWSNKSSRNVGAYTVTITGKGNYTGVTKATYKINPKGTSLKKPAKAKKAITVKWKKQSAKMAKSRITGYQIQLATNKKFTKNKKTVNVKGYKKVSKKVTNLKGGKTYYLKIRTYKTIKGKKYYSKWSKVKAIKTKK